MFTLHPAWRDRTPYMLVFLTGLLAIMAVLVHRDPWFGCFTPAAVAGAARASTIDKTGQPSPYAGGQFAHPA